MQIITTHKNTDFDALASVIGATILYPKAIPVLPKVLNPNVKGFLSIHKDVFEILTPDDVDLDKVESLVIVDVNKWERLENMEKLRQKQQNGNNFEVILWDHHLHDGDIEADWKCQEEIGSTITLISRQLKKDKIEISPIHATLFLTGLYEDTGTLMFPSTTAEDAYAAGYLLEQKADLNVVNSLLRPAYGEKQKNILFEMLQSAKRTDINGYKISFNKLAIEGHVGNLSVVVHMYREILNADAAFGIFASKDNGRCMLIGRSNIEGINIGSIMRQFGGGGHPGAGSAMLKSVNPDSVEEMITELIKGDQQSSVRISDLMSFPVTTVSPDTAMKDVAMILREKGFTGLPVAENGKILGVISRRDFRKVRKDSALNAPVKAFMSKDIKTIEAGKTPMHAARLMVKYDIGRLPVVENGNVIGIITRSDAMLYFYDLMPD